MAIFDVVLFFHIFGYKNLKEDFMDTRKFKAKSEIIEKQLPRILGNNQYKGKTVTAIDLGYSAVKGASPDRVFSLPSYAKKVAEGFEIVGQLSDSDVFLRNKKTEETWLIGQTAETMMDQSDLDSLTDASIYARYRYDSEMYRVLMAAGVALGSIGMPKGNEIFLQTGLPSAYKVADTPKLISALEGDYDLEIKIGNAPFVPVSFSLSEENIGVMEQPQGTLCSIAFKDGEQTSFGAQVMGSNSIILDIGFGTEDVFPIRKGMKSKSKTYSDTAMRAVFEKTIEFMREDNPDLNVKTFELQKYLEAGKVSYFDSYSFQMNYIPFEEHMRRANEELCEKTIERLMQDFQNLQDYQYLIVTGGTGESRFEQIKEKLSAIPTLTVLPGNLNVPDLSCTYSNVIGYYMFRHASNARDKRKAEAGE